MQLKYEKQHLHASLGAFQNTYNSNICLPLPRSHFSPFGSNSLRLCFFSGSIYPPKKQSFQCAETTKCVRKLC